MAGSNSIEDTTDASAYDQKKEERQGHWQERDSGNWRYTDKAVAAAAAAFAGTNCQLIIVSALSGKNRKPAKTKKLTTILQKVFKLTAANFKTLIRADSSVRALIALTVHNEWQGTSTRAPKCCCHVASDNDNDVNKKRRQWFQC